MKSRYSDVQKISLSAFLLILATLATVIAKMSGIPFLRFCQITFAPAVIMFASLSMGPLYGANVGGGSDLLGFLLYPTGTLNPFYTILAILWGVLPWLLLMVTKKWRSALRFPWMVYATLAIIMGLLIYGFFGTGYFSQRFETTFGESALAAKIVFLCIQLAMDIGLCIGLSFTNKYFQKSILDYPDIPSPNEVALIATICELVIGVLGNASALMFYFYVIVDTGTALSFAAILLFLLAMSSINILVNSALLSWLLIFSRRFGVTSRNNGGEQ
jgi:hypothetical protein